MAGIDGTLADRAVLPQSDTKTRNKKRHKKAKTKQYDTTSSQIVLPNNEERRHSPANKEDLIYFRWFQKPVRFAAILCFDLRQRKHKSDVKFGHDRRLHYVFDRPPISKGNKYICSDFWHIRNELVGNINHNYSKATSINKCIWDGLIISTFTLSHGVFSSKLLSPSQASFKNLVY